MKPANLLPLFFFLLLLAPSIGNTAGSMLRITCEGDDVGAEVTINGQFKGECPIDLQVTAGMNKLQVVKNNVNKTDYIFEQDIRMGEGSVKKIDVRLVPKSLLPYFKKAESGDFTAMIHLSKVYMGGLSGVRIDREQTFKWALKGAEAGSGIAMAMVGTFYRYGFGVEKDENKSKYWDRKGFEINKQAAENGDSDAIYQIGLAYYFGNGVKKDEKTALMWIRKGIAMGNEDSKDLLNSINSN